MVENCSHSYFKVRQYVTTVQHIDFTETSPPDDYVMTYVLRAPCAPDGDLVAKYDVRWNVKIVGEDVGMSTNTFLVTVGSKRKGSGSNALVDSPPIAMRVMVGN